MDQQECKYCKQSYHKTKFIRIIRRRTHSPDSDEDGNSLYMKPCKMCATCRKINNAKRISKLKKQ